MLAESRPPASPSPPSPPPPPPISAQHSKVCFVPFLSCLCYASAFILRRLRFNVCGVFIIFCTLARGFFTWLTCATSQQHHHHHQQQQQQQQQQTRTYQCVVALPLISPLPRIFVRTGEFFFGEKVATTQHVLAK